MSEKEAERIRALYRLADGTPYESEARSARGKARQLQCKYGITDAMLANRSRQARPNPESQATRTPDGWVYATTSTTTTAHDFRSFTEAVSRANPNWRVIIINFP